MDTFELRKEQLKLAPKITLRDGFDKISSIAGIECFALKDKLLACVVVCEYPSLKLKEVKSYVLNNPLPYHPEFQAYRETPAMIEAYNLLDEEPDVILVKGTGILHPRRLGIASHLGLALNKPVIGIALKLPFGNLREKEIIYQDEVVGFELKSREFANPLYITPGHLVSLGSMLEIVTKTLRFPHKIPEPLHLAHKAGKKKLGGMNVKIPAVKVEVQAPSLGVQPCL